MTRFEVVRDPVLGEEVWLATTTAGMPVRVVPRPALRETAAAIAFGYGSIDLEFDAGHGKVATPAGTAHYLEHKLFEDEDLHTFDRFAARGARVNASTGFTRTTYHFTAVGLARENLTDLLRLVATAHITKANVDKERGIIAQEVRMYEDAPDFCTTFDLLGCLYGRHPVRYTVGGTVESIQQITDEVLLACWRAFYRAGNAALAVAGPVDPELVLHLAEGAGLPPGPAPRRLLPAEPDPPACRHKQRAMAVARPKVLLGCKDPVPAAEDAQALLWRQVASRVLLDRLFAPSSEVREALHQRGDVDDSLGAGYLGDRTFGVATVGCESDEPERAAAALRKVLLAPAPLTDEHLERVRRRFLGSYVRGLESVRALAFGHVQEALDGLAPFSAVAVVQGLTVADLRARQEALLAEDRLALAVTAAAPPQRGSQ